MNVFYILGIIVLGITLLLLGVAGLIAATILLCGD